MNIRKLFADHAAGLAWTGASIVLTFFLHYIGLFNLLNYKVYDFAFAQVRGPLAGSTARFPINRDSLKVVIVDVDDESWRLVPFKWPYPREEVWAHAIRNLTDAGAKVIVFDIEFDSPDFKSDYLEKFNLTGAIANFRHGDEVLAEAIVYAQARGTRVVMASKLVTEPTRFPPQYIATPVSRIMTADPETGLTNEIKDFDGVTRKYAMFYELNQEPGTWYLPLGLKALKEYWGLADSTLPVIDMDNLEVRYGPATIKTYGRNASYLVNFYGPASGSSLPGEDAWKTFDRYPLANILDDASFDLAPIEEDSDWMDFFKLDGDLYGFLGESPFLNKIVLIGVSVNILLDVKSTPFYNYAGLAQLMPGVEYHANAVQTVLDGNYIEVLGGTIELTRHSWRAHLGMIILVALLTFLVTVRLSPIGGGVVAMVGVLLYLDVALGLFTADMFWLPKLAGVTLLPRALVLAAPSLFTIDVPALGASLYVPVIPGIASIILTYGSIVIYQYLLEQKDKHFLKDNFSTYISPELIDQMFEEKSMPELGGESQLLTAYFTDVASFSTFSEALSASRLVELLNEYLTVMTDILLEQQGTLDKYEGDAIIAFFGAPLRFEDHAYRAAMVALDMQMALGELRKKWNDEGDKWPDMVPEMRMRIGINAGDIVTGNMGSKTRMNYTMMGDVVNTAARLEASAKQYGIYIQTTLPTLEMIGPDKVEWRFIDKVKVVGKTIAIDAVEIMAAAGELPDEQMKMREIYLQGMDLYRGQEWDGAIKKFTESEKLEEVFPKRPTTPSRVYVDRCGYFKENPPGADWDGSWSLTAK
ncbi:MAG: adenylate/guanylate cyclase domain-containing protein [Candidatus Marinimicrobia bacterium]|nr:adenylate/guanylate cyclase domain-containing protein [Candidatus Neomarinimicrobiota bacterium]